MKKKWWLAVWVMSVLALLLNAASIYKVQIKTLRNELTNLEAYRGKVILIVNIASKSAYTPQLSGLEKLYNTYSSRGFTVIGFPTGQSASQELLDGEELEQFCEHKYSVTFPIFGKIDAYGSKADSLYYYLKNGMTGVNKSGSIEWNFTKYLVDRRGIVLRRYSPRVTPDEIAADIEKLL